MRASRPRNELGDSDPAELTEGFDAERIGPNGRRAWLREAYRQLEQQRWLTAEPIPRSRVDRLRLAVRWLEDELAAECRGNGAYEAMREQRRLHDKRRLGGPTKPYTPPPVPQGEVNLTDPDSRRMKGNRRYIQGYNAQAVVNEQQIAIAAEITTAAADFSQLRPMIETALDELEHAGVSDKPSAVVADAQYWNEQHMDNLIAGHGLPVLIRPTAANATASDPAGPAAGSRSCDARSPPTPARSSIENGKRRLSRYSVTPNTTGNLPVQLPRQTGSPHRVATGPDEPQPHQARGSRMLKEEPSSTPTGRPFSHDLQNTLSAEIAAADHAHFPLKVALIASPADLGVIPDLLDQPQTYADFLDQEISFQTKQPLLVVMPGGYGVEGLPRASSNAATTLAKPAGPQPNALARAGRTGRAQARGSRR